MRAALDKCSRIGCFLRRRAGQFVHRTALGYVSGRYGSQRFHRAECGLDPASIVAELNRAVLA